MFRFRFTAAASGALFAAGLTCGAAWGQSPNPNAATLKTDGQWRAAFGLGLSNASGNSSANSLSLTGDAVRATAIDKWTLGGRYLRARSNGTTTADQAALGTRYDRDIAGPWFVFGQGGYLRDRIANLSAEYSLAAGVGYHVIRNPINTFDVFGGVGYVNDSYIRPVQVAGQIRDSYGRAEGLVGEESTHRLTDSTSFRQRLTYYPALRDGTRRALFDAGLVVAINKSFALNATLGYRYNSDPGLGLKTSDTLFVTGITYRLD